MDLNQNGSLSAEEFLAIPELQQNPLVRRVIDILDTDRNGEVDFQGQLFICYKNCYFSFTNTEFIEGVSQFSVQGDKDKKLMCKFFIHVILKTTSMLGIVAFRIYDIDQDGFISNGELFQVLKTMVGCNLTDKQLQEIVDKTILYADKDGDGKISYEEFCDVSYSS